ncbi:maltose ABC transporter permease MalG [Corallincola spongiicola]|uniref:Maltose/maltodextrin transport system permease protein MalG n=1 Tax=Corallincola spongiicola TaxID=2520508 RepID=A0ABY1WQQ5_9GAMM|nr:maltose ABC transporter permease MalG [Corallincola spongiicola]TAA47049.1 maltose ABC transporter permease MalG [Corallincola spongiicola]
MAIVEAKNTRYRVWLTYLFLALFIAGMMYPLLAMISISFRTGNLLNGSLIPDNPSLEHWRLVFGIGSEEEQKWFKNFPVLLWTWNSIKIAFITSAISIVFSSMAAYAFARMKFIGSKWLLTSLLIIGLFPALTGMVAIRIMLEKIGYFIPALGFDTHGGLMLLYLSAVLGEIWLIKGYIQSLDPALEEAATMDGASRWQTLRYIVLPLCLPILVVTFILSFIAAFGEYAFANMMLSDPDKFTLALGMQSFLNQTYAPLWGDFAATAIFAALPITLVFLIGQKWLIGGLTSGSVKG